MERTRSRECVDVTQLKKVVRPYVAVDDSCGLTTKLKDAVDVVLTESIDDLRVLVDGWVCMDIHVIERHADDVECSTDHAHVRQPEEVRFHEAQILGVVLVDAQHLAHV